jgi:hypothetical protein
MKTVIIPRQIAPNGSFPLELARTKPYGYSLFNLDAIATCCQVLSTMSDNLWTFSTPNGRGVAQAIGFMYPYIRNKDTWPYRHDIEYFADWPLRQPSLLFGCEALDQPAWFVGLEDV